MFQSYRELQHRAIALKARLIEYSGLPAELIENIVQYAKAMVPPFGQHIQENVFYSQMSLQFEFTNVYIIYRMRAVLRSKRYKKLLFDTKEYPNLVSVEELCLCVCTFLTQNQDLKIDWVFAVYDINDDGVLNRQDLYALLKPCILHTEDTDYEESVKDMMDIVMAVVDRSKNGDIDLDEFRRLVKSNILYIDLCGCCIPEVNVLRKFRDKIEFKSTVQVLTMFRTECQSIMPEVPIRQEDPLYSVVLEFP